MRIDANLMCLIFMGVWGFVVGVYVVATALAGQVLLPPAETWGIPAGGITLIKVFMREDQAPKGDK